jgi:putative CocE/NonD family hydrolase
MKIKTDFPRRIHEIENTWIPLADGTRLAARIWLPEDAESNPVPALLEYIPYRKNDGTAVRDAMRHPYLAGHGYASIRVDMRGSGDSDGILYDEYLKQEQDDALEVLKWIAAQPWCTGSIGMFGKSWGGFNALQVAARRPPELKAIITIASTDDRYADDVHYMGGCLLASQMLPWASVMFAYNATPPDPRFVGERWREMWLNRMEHTPPFIETWLAHQRRDAFWKHGSVSEDFSAIACAVYAVGGWADAYTNAIPRLLAGLSCPRKGLIGPWSHNFPETGVPGPSIGFLQESLRWWDHWLKGIDSGIMHEPMLRAWVQDSQPPAVLHAEWPGHWVAESEWPSPHILERAYVLNQQQTLDDKAGEEARLEHRGSQSTGIDAGVWCPYGVPGDFPPDQQAEDGRSLSFTSAPLDEAMSILGFPEARLSIAADRPNALVAVRLCDVAPSGASTLVSWGLLNLTHRESHEHPTPLVPGERYDVRILLNATGYTLPAGHRWRVSIAPTYWPPAWPSPEAVTLSLFGGTRSQLILPVRVSRPEDVTLTPFPPAEGSRPLRIQMLRNAAHQRNVQHDVIAGRIELITVKDDGRTLFVDNGLEHDEFTRERFTIHEGDPLSAIVKCEHVIEFERGEWHAKIETVSQMTSTATHFHVTNVLEGYERNTRVFAKTWTFNVPRDLV